LHVSIGPHALLDAIAVSDPAGCCTAERRKRGSLMDYGHTQEYQMAVRKQTVSFTEPAFDYARKLVDAGEYPNISAAVSGEMVRARAARESQATQLAAEVERRLALPLDQWEPVGELREVTGEARARLTDLRRTQAGKHG
jgi:antitoxin ParD1/3/4